MRCHNSIQSLLLIKNYISIYLVCIKLRKDTLLITCDVFFLEKGTERDHANAGRQAQKPGFEFRLPDEQQKAYLELFYNS